MSGQPIIGYNITLKYIVFSGGNVDNLGKIDGVDQWRSLTNTLTPIRLTLLVNIDEKSGEEAFIFNQWKVVKSITL